MRPNAARCEVVVFPLVFLKASESPEGEAAMPEALLAIALPDTSWALDNWLLRTTLAGGVVLCLGSLWMVFTKQPSHRQRIGEIALLTALLVALPAALPAWWSLPGTHQNDATQRAIFGHLPVQNQNPSKTVELVEVPVDGNQYAWEEDESVEFDVAALIKAVQEEQEALTQKDGKSLVIPDTNDSDTKGFVAPVTMSNWFRWTTRILGIGYLGLVLVLLGRCVIGYYGLWRYWRLRRPAPAHVCTALAELEPDESRRPRIGVNPLVPGPVSYGLWKPTILLPPKFCNEGDPEKLRWILAHELTHLQRRDAWSCLLLALGGALYFHVPWFWWMKRHVRLAQEYLADAAAVKLSNAVEYAQYLVSLTTLASRPTLASSQAAGVFETPSDLYRRVDMLLHQRSALDRSAPRWWTLTAAASFLALAACTSGIKLYADDTDIKVVEGVAIVTSDDDDDDDKKVEKKKSVIRVDGKLLKTDDKNVVIVQDDKNKGDKVKEVRGFFTGDHQAKIDEAIKKLDAALEKLPKQLDADTRARLEELKKTLSSMKANHGEWHFVAPKISGEWQGKIQEQARKAGDDAKRAGEEARRVAEVYRVRAQEMAEAARAQAQNAEKLAKVAQEKALKRWTEAKDGKGRDDAIAELEKAIEAKEKALRALKTDGKLAEARVQDDRRRVVERLSTARSDAASSSPKGRFGVVVGDIDNNLRGHLDLAEGQGLMVNEVIDPSPAWNKGNGLRSSDILIELGGKSIPSNQDKFRELVSKLPEGDVRAVVIRKGKKVNINGIKLPAASKPSNVVIRQPNDVHVDGRHIVGEVVVDGKHVDLAKVEGRPLRLTTRIVGDDVKTAPLAGVRSLNLDGVAKVEGVVKVDKADVVVDHVKIAPADVIVRPMTTFRTTTAPTTFQGVQVGSKPRLGVSLAEVPETVASQVELADDRGLLVIEVTDGSAAKKAGFLKNDILIEFADKPVTRNHPDFTKMVKELKPGKYTATVVRKGKEIRIRDIQLTDAKADTVKAKDWMVDDEEKADKPKAKDAVKSDKKKDEKDADFFPQARNNNRAFNLARNNGNTSITLNDGKFTIKNDRDGKAITIIGKVVEGKATPDSITIKGEDSEKKYKAVKDVPAEDRASVEKLLSNIKGNTFQFGNINGNFNNAQFEKVFQEKMKRFEKEMEKLGEGNGDFEMLQQQMEQLRKQLNNLKNNKPGEENNEPVNNLIG